MNGCENCAKLRARVEELEGEVRGFRGREFLTKLEVRIPVGDRGVDVEAVRCESCDEWCEKVEGGLCPGCVGEL